ncbi:Ubiquitin carboxyl-terminal hydrolase [Trichinella spiralis]|uniref:Ubiquitin carboxyl-terminal hydrolase n=1 Tax=Trichinella spiralis TaxID=6334 RepID=A0ABR3K887_TRISP
MQHVGFYSFAHIHERCEVLDQLESTQQNRSQPGQIKAQLIILIDKRRLHAWRQISLRKIDEQFLMSFDQRLVRSSVD